MHSDDFTKLNPSCCSGWDSFYLHVEVIYLQDQGSGCFLPICNAVWRQIEKSKNRTFYTYLKRNVLVLYRSSFWEETVQTCFSFRYLRVEAATFTVVIKITGLSGTLWFPVKHAQYLDPRSLSLRPYYVTHNHQFPWHTECNTLYWLPQSQVQHIKPMKHSKVYERTVRSFDSDT